MTSYFSVVFYPLPVQNKNGMVYFTLLANTIHQPNVLYNKLIITSTSAE